MERSTNKKTFLGFSRFRKDERGVTLIEFAIILPIMVLLFIALVEFTEAFIVSRKLAQTANTVADLVAQEPSITDAQLADIQQVGSQIMQPFSNVPLNLVTISVVADANNVTTVDWSFPAGAVAPGSPFDLPEAGLTEANSSIIVTEATYNFTPTLSNFLGTFQINEDAFFRPRLTPNVAKLD